MFTSKEWKLNNSHRQGEGSLLIAPAKRLKSTGLPFCANKPFMTVFVAAALWCSVSISSAATLTWTGAGGTTDWFYPANWGQTVVPPRPPVAGDIIYIGTNTAGAAANGTVIMGPGSGAGNSLYLGYTPGTTGDLTVQQGASLTISGNAYLGQQGTGTLNIDGGSVTSSRIFVGYFNGSSTGVGELQITNGGVLTTTGGSANYVSYTPTAATTVSAPSTVLIDGKSSAWYSSNMVILGAGSGASSATLTVQNGGLLYIGGNLGTNYGLALASGVTSTADVTITGQGSTINSTPGIVVGGGGTANVSVLNGATLLTSSAVNDYDYIGQTTTLAGDRSVGHVLVDGVGSSWVSSKGIAVGYAGIGTLTISNGATVTNTSDSYIGVTRGNSGGIWAPYAGSGEALITGQGSTWTTGILDIAVDSGAEGVLTVSDGGTLKTTDSDGVRVGNDGHGVINIGASGGQASVAPGNILADNILLVDRSRSEINFNHTATDADNYAFSPSVSGDGTVNVLSGVTLLTGTNTYSGPTTILGGVLKAGGASAFSPNSDFDVGSAGTLDVNGINQTVLSLTNAGLVNMGAGRPPGTVLTMSNYIGQGGTIALNTFLGNDGSPSDRIVIDGGTATGNTFLHFTNAGGSGAQTTANGILVVDAISGATTAALAFTMSNPELRAGAYDYRLFQGGPDGSDPDNWYLRSTFIPTPGPMPEPTPNPLPIVGPELATYGVVQPVAQQLGRSMLGTHDERFGDLYATGSPCQSSESKAPRYTWAPVTPAACDSEGWRPAIWGRLFGQQIDNRYQSLADPRSDGQIAGLQAGVDLLRSDGLIAGHKDYAGLYFAYGNANVDVSGLVTNAAATAYVLQHTGSLNLNAYSGGAYWTHYGPQDWYLDLVLQGTSYSGAASTEFARLETNGAGFISSIESGYPIALQVFGLGLGFVLEPQAQVLWQWVSFDSSNDELGSVVLGTTSATTARVGLKGKWTITTDSGQLWQPYVRANFWSDFGSSAATLFGPDSISLISHAQYMDVDAGFTTKTDTHFSAFVDAGYQFAVSNDGGGRRDGVKGTAGLRYQW